MTITFEINMVSLAWVVMFACNFIVDDTVKTKKFFVQQRERYRSSRSNREFFPFSWRERLVPFLFSRKNSNCVHEHFDLVEVIA